MRRTASTTSRRDEIDINLGGIADQTDDRVLRTFGHVQFEAAAFEKFREIFNLLLICVFFEKNNHAVFPPSYALKQLRSVFTAEPGFLRIVPFSEFQMQQNTLSEAPIKLK